MLEGHFRDWMAPLMDHTAPPLTTIRLNSLEIGRIAALTALAAIEYRERQPMSSTLPPQLIVRASTTWPTPSSRPGVEVSKP